MRIETFLKKCRCITAPQPLERGGNPAPSCLQLLTKPRLAGPGVLPVHRLVQFPAPARLLGQSTQPFRMRAGPETRAFQKGTS